jgi:hypothetical protein
MIDPTIKQKYICGETGKKYFYKKYGTCWADCWEIEEGEKLGRKLDYSSKEDSKIIRKIEELERAEGNLRDWSRRKRWVSKAKKIIESDNKDNKKG